MPGRNLVSWTSAISSLVGSGHPELGLREFFLMCNSGLKPNEFGLSLVLKASRLTHRLASGELIHACAVKSGFESYAFCSTSIVDMYVKLGRMREARRFFDLVLPTCDALWNAMIDGHARSSEADEAFWLFHRMLLSCSSANSVTYTILIKLSSASDDIDLLSFLHGRTIKVGFDKYSFVGSALVNIYARHGHLSDASRVFWSIEEPDQVTWTALLSGLIENGDVERGLELYLKFASRGHRLDLYMFASVLSLCTGLGDLGLGLQVHSCFIKSGFAVDSFVGRAFVDMYAGFGMVEDAYRCFIGIRDKNEIVFGAMIQSFVYCSDYTSALELLSEMRELGLAPDKSTLNYILKAYAHMDMMRDGRVIHGLLMKMALGCDIFTWNNLIEMYASCKAIDEATKVFLTMEVQNEFSWTALISGYIELERHAGALELFRNMQSSENTKANEFTLVAVLNACLKLRELDGGKQVHNYIIKLGFQYHPYIEAALMGMYSKCNCIEDASLIFYSMSQRDLVSLSTMIAAHVEHGQGEKALRLVSECQDGIVAVDESILSSCFSVCSSLTALEMGRCLHGSSIVTGFGSSLKVEGAVVDMYSKCGSISDAQTFFHAMKEHNVVSYTAMICGYAQHGHGQDALNLFHVMREAGVEPDSVTFVGVLSACRHIGLVKEGWYYFESMRKDYGIERTMTHYACMVDLLGRAGHVTEAEELIQKAPFPLKASLWKTILGACSNNGSIEVGKRSAEMLVRLEPDDPSIYVSLSNIYASAAKWDHSIYVKNKIKEGCMMKTPGFSCIQITR